jgi:glycerophosphoryl diester phosphodiesterase
MRFVALLLVLAANTVAADSPVHFQAHRGGLREVPENTLAAFHHAWALGAAPEIDIRTTSDGIIICLHDDILKRTTSATLNADTPVNQLTLAEVQEPDAGAWFDPKFAGEKVPELRSVLEILRDHKDYEVYLDLKAVDLQRLAALIKEYGVAKQIIFAHNKAESCREIKAAVPDLRAGVWIGGTANEIYTKFQKLASEKFAGLDLIQLHLNAAASGDWPYALSRAQLHQAVALTQAAGIVLEVLPSHFTCDELGELLAMDIRWYSTDEPKKFKDCLDALDAKDFLANGVTAHRGDSGAFPENTLPAIESALTLGADWIEIDIHRSKDGALVVIHDESTGRTGDRDIPVASSTVQELRAVDMAAAFRKEKGLDETACPPEPMPTLRQVLMRIIRQDKTRLSIQPKADVVDDAIALIKEVNAQDWVGFNDGDLAKMKRVKELAPEIPVFWDRPADFPAAQDIATAKELRFESIVVKAEGATPETVAAINAAGLESGAWTVNDEAEMKRLRSLGVKRIYTDFPGTLLGIEN